MNFNRYFMGIILLLMTVTSWAQANNVANTAQAELPAPTLYPDLNVMSFAQQGPIIIVDQSGSTKIALNSIYTGIAYILGQYEGKRLEDSSTGILLSDQKLFNPISSIDFFSKLDVDKKGFLTSSQYQKAQLAFFYINATGLPMVVSVHSFGVTKVNYDLKKGTVTLELPAGKSFVGSVYDFSNKAK